MSSTTRRSTSSKGVEAAVGKECDRCGVRRSWRQHLRRRTRCPASPRNHGHIRQRIGGRATPVAPLALMGKSLHADSPEAVGLHAARKRSAMRRWNEVVGWVESGDLDVRIGLEVPLAEAADAHRALESRQTTGKLLLATVMPSDEHHPDLAEFEALRRLASGTVCPTPAHGGPVNRTGGNRHRSPPGSVATASRRLGPARGSGEQRRHGGSPSEAATIRQVDIDRWADNVASIHSPTSSW